ncbi:sequestosome-1 [Halyomorpha halys]|uniref:sequestosome-1 n=1 Tax=Halyomorpha halys TaxID=286706 RepID=UPI0006D4C7A5|nr:sequestosome-1-like [Halyomorpha halys]
MLPFSFSQNCAATVECKVYFTAPNEEEEIRCILLNGMCRFDYLYVRHKITEIFPALKNYDFDLHWRDEEGDKIKITSNDDLIILINRHNNSRVKKLYVTLKELRDNLANNPGELLDNPVSNLKISGPVIHNGVTCDGCQQKPLQGYRYKCIVCPDFDICMNCEKSEKIHSHHPMIRFPVPLTSENFFSSEYENIRNNINGILQMFN